MRGWFGAAALAGVAAGFLCAPLSVWAQSGGSSAPQQPQSGQQSSPSGSSDNPFPEQAPQQNPQQGPQAKPKDAPNQKPGDASPGGSKDNPFPGENSDAPIIPVGPEGAAGAGSGTGADADPRRGSDPDGDPMRSPDPAVNTTDDGFSSSRTGLKQIPAEDDNDGRPGKSSKNKTRSQLIAEDLDVGKYYLERKNWKAAEARFSAAFTLDGENPDAVWGMAEAERHLNEFKDAADHYKLFLSYDPDGPHSKSARKSLEEVESARPAVTMTAKPDSAEKPGP